VSIRPNGAAPPPSGVVVAVMPRTLPGRTAAGYRRHAVAGRGDVSSGGPTSPAPVTLSPRRLPRAARSRQARSARAVTLRYVSTGDGMRSAGKYVQYSEAPPCMRWRGLARPYSPACRLLGWPVTQLLSAADRTACADARLELRSPGAPCVPESPPDRYPREVVSAFLLPGQAAAQDLHESNIKILWPSTGRPPLSPAYRRLSTGSSTRRSTGAVSEMAQPTARLRGASMSAHAAAIN